MGAQVCNRCGQASQARTPLVGDIIMGPLGVSASGEDTGMVDADVTVTPSLTAGLPLLDLPSDFTQRIRTLPSNTILHVPASCRLRMISAVRESSSPPTVELSKATFSAPSRAPLSWVKRARRKCRTSFPLLSSKRESATNGSLMMGRVLSGPCSSTGGFAHWTPPWPLLGPHGVVLHSATPRAQRGSCVRPNEHTSSVAGTPPTSTTPSSSSARTQARPLWAWLSAPASKSTLGPRVGARVR